MKIFNILTIFCFMISPVYAAAQSQSEIIQGFTGNQIKNEKTQKAEHDERLDILKESNRRPLWSAQQMDEMAREQAKKSSELNGPDILYMIPLKL